MQGNFSYHNPTKLYFGDESLNFLKDELKNFGPVVLLNYGSGSVKRNGIYDQVIAILKEAGLSQGYIVLPFWLTPIPRLTGMLKRPYHIKTGTGVFYSPSSSSILQICRVSRRASFQRGKNLSISAWKRAL